MGYKNAILPGNQLLEDEANLEVEGEDEGEPSLLLLFLSLQRNPCPKDNLRCFEVGEEDDDDTALA